MAGGTAQDKQMPDKMVVGNFFNGIEQLLTDMAAGKKYMKVYKQMKMYNDESLNPVLYQNKS